MKYAPRIYTGAFSKVIENQGTMVTSVVVIVVTTVTAVTQDLVACQGKKNQMTCLKWK
jgi:hypothetical protein